MKIMLCNISRSNHLNVLQPLIRDIYLGYCEVSDEIYLSVKFGNQYWGTPILSSNDLYLVIEMAHLG